jgi:hypothetical protein
MKILRESTSGMHTKRLLHYRVVLNPIQIYVKAQVMISHLMKNMYRTGGKPTFRIFYT